MGLTQDVSNTQDGGAAAAGAAPVVVLPPKEIKVKESVQQQEYEATTSTPPASEPSVPSISDDYVSRVYGYVQDNPKTSTKLSQEDFKAKYFNDTGAMLGLYKDLNARTFASPPEFNLGSTFREFKSQAIVQPIEPKVEETKKWEEQKSTYTDAQEAEIQEIWDTDPNVQEAKAQYLEDTGEEMDINNPTYDYRKAILDGVRPKPNPEHTLKNGEDAYHWASLTEDGQHLKSPDHPTRALAENNAEIVEKDAGVDFNDVDAEELYDTFLPKIQALETDKIQAPQFEVTANFSGGSTFEEAIKIQDEINVKNEDSFNRQKRIIEDLAITHPNRLLDDDFVEGLEAKYEQLNLPSNIKDELEEIRKSVAGKTVIDEQIINKVIDAPSRKERAISEINGVSFPNLGFGDDEAIQAIFDENESLDEFLSMLNVKDGESISEALYRRGGNLGMKFSAIDGKPSRKLRTLDVKRLAWDSGLEEGLKKEARDKGVDDRLVDAEFAKLKEQGWADIRSNQKDKELTELRKEHKFLSEDNLERTWARKTTAKVIGSLSDEDQRLVAIEKEVRDLLDPMLNESISGEEYKKLNELNAERATLTETARFTNPVTGERIAEEEVTKGDRQRQDAIYADAKDLTENFGDKIEQIFLKRYLDFQAAEERYNTLKKQDQEGFGKDIASKGGRLAVSGYFKSGLLKDAENILIAKRGEYEAATQAYLLNKDVTTMEKDIVYWSTLIAKPAIEAFIPEEIYKELKINDAFITSTSSRELMDNTLKAFGDGTFSTDQLASFERTFMENTAEFGGGLIGIVPTLVGFNKAQGALGVTRLITTIKNSKKLGKFAGLLGGLLEVTAEEAKLGLAGFHTGEGAGFILAGRVMPKIKLTGRLGMIAEPFMNSMLLGSVGGTAGLETAKLFSTTVDAFVENKDYKYRLDQAGFGDLSEASQRIMTELVVNSLYGGTHIMSKGGRVNFISEKNLGMLALELRTKGKAQEAVVVENRLAQLTKENKVVNKFDQTNDINTITVGKDGAKSKYEQVDNEADFAEQKYSIDGREMDRATFLERANAADTRAKAVEGGEVDIQVHNDQKTADLVNKLYEVETPANAPKTDAKSETKAEPVASEEKDTRKEAEATLSTEDRETGETTETKVEPTEEGKFDELESVKKADKIAADKVKIEEAKAESKAKEEAKAAEIKVGDTLFFKGVEHTVLEVRENDVVFETKEGKHSGEKGTTDMKSAKALKKLAITKAEAKEVEAPKVEEEVKPVEKKVETPKPEPITEAEAQKKVDTAKKELKEHKDARAIPIKEFRPEKTKAEKEVAELQAELDKLESKGEVSKTLLDTFGSSKMKGNTVSEWIGHVKAELKVAERTAAIEAQKTLAAANEVAVKAKNKKTAQLEYELKLAERTLGESKGEVNLIEGDLFGTADRYVTDKGFVEHLDGKIKEAEESITKSKERKERIKAEHKKYKVEDPLELKMADEFIDKANHDLTEAKKAKDAFLKKDAPKAEVKPVEKKKIQIAEPLTETERRVVARGESVNQHSVIEDALIPKKIGRQEKAKSQYDRAIERGEITAEEAAAAIESAGFEVPESISKLIKPKAEVKLTESESKLADAIDKRQTAKTPKDKKTNDTQIQRASKAEELETTAEEREAIKKDLGLSTKSTTYGALIKNAAKEGKTGKEVIEAVRNAKKTTAEKIRKVKELEAKEAAIAQEKANKTALAELDRIDAENKVKAEEKAKAEVGNEAKRIEQAKKDAETLSMGNAEREAQKKKNRAETIESKEKDTRKEVDIKNRKRKDLFPNEKKSEFANVVGESGQNSKISSYREVNGIGIAEYTNPNSGVVDIIMSGTSDNNFIGYVRIYKNGKPTNRWTSKMENKSQNKANIKTMLAEVQKSLPQGHEYTEKKNISLDGLKTYTQQLNYGYEILLDKNGNPVMNQIDLNKASVETLQNAKSKAEIRNLYNDYEGLTRNQFNEIKAKINVLFPQARVLPFNQAKGNVTINLPVLKSKPKPKAEPKEGAKNIEVKKVTKKVIEDAMAEVEKLAEEGKPTNLVTINGQQIGKAIVDTKLSATAKEALTNKFREIQKKAAAESKKTDAALKVAEKRTEEERRREEQRDALDEAGTETKETSKKKTVKKGSTVAVKIERAPDKYKSVEEATEKEKKALLKEDMPNADFKTIDSETLDMLYESAVAERLEKERAQEIENEKSIDGKGRTVVPVQKQTARIGSTGTTSNGRIAPMKRGAANPKPKAPHEIQLDLTRGMGIKIRTGHKGIVSKRSLGEFDPMNLSLKVRRNNDLDVTAHEIGHFIDNTEGILDKWTDENSATLDAELRDFWKHGSPAPTHGKDSKGNKVKLTAEEILAYRRGEGIAEYIRGWILNPVEAVKRAPEFSKVFESSLTKRTKEPLETFAKDIREWNGSTSHEQAISTVERFRDDKDFTFSGWIHNLVGNFAKPSDGSFGLTSYDRLRRTWTDKRISINAGLKHAAAIKGEKELLPMNDPILLGRLLLGFNSKYNNIINNGMITAKHERMTDNGNIMNFDWLFKPLDATDGKTFDADIDLVQTFMIAEQTLQRIERDFKEADAKAEKEYKEAVIKSAKEGKDVSKVKKKEVKRRDADVDVTGIGAGLKADSVQSKEILAEFAELENSNPEKAANIREAARRYRKMAEAVMQYAADKGRFSQGHVEAMKKDNSHYVTLQTIGQSFAGELDYAGKWYQTQSRENLSTAFKFKKAKGSMKTKLDPYAGLMDVVHNTIKEADRNEVMSTMVDAISPTKAGQDLASVGYKLESGEGGIVLFREGKEERWEFDKDIADALQGIHQFSQKLPQIATAITRMTRATITSTPTFALRNSIRDTASRMVLSRTKSKSLNLFSRAGVSELELYGGDQAGYYLKDKATYYSTLNALSKKLTGERNSIIVDAKNLGTWYKNQISKSETANRLVEFKSAFKEAKKKGMDDYNAQLYAAFQARDLMDFAVTGEVMQIINQIVPFSNAAVQGLNRTIKGAKENPAGFAARWALYSVLPTMFERAFNLSMGDYEELMQFPAYRKDLYWNFKVNGTWLSIPKPFEIGVLGSGMGRAFDEGYHQITGKGNKRAFEGYGKTLQHSFMPISKDVMAGGFKPLIESYINYDTFRQRALVPTWENDAKLDLRNPQYASNLGKTMQRGTDALGIGMDARKIDHMTKSLFSSWGVWIMALTDIGREDKKGFGLHTLGLFAQSPAVDSPDSQWIMKTAKLEKMTGSREFSAYKFRVKKFYEETDPTKREERRVELLRYSSETRDKWEDRIEEHTHLNPKYRNLLNKEED